MAESYPISPPYEAPGIPTLPRSLLSDARGGRGAMESGRFFPSYGAEPLQLQLRHTYHPINHPTPSTTTMQPPADHNGAIIPDPVLYSIAQDQYNYYFDKFCLASSSHHQRYNIISLLEKAERHYEDSVRYLERQSYEKTASAFIKGYTVFKYAEKLNLDPSIADLISSLRVLYSNSLFEKLKDITDDVFFEEKQKLNAETAETTAPEHSVSQLSSEYDPSDGLRTLDPSRMASSTSFKTSNDISAPPSPPSVPYQHQTVSRSATTPQHQATQPLPPSIPPPYPPSIPPQVPHAVPPPIPSGPPSIAPPPLPSEPHFNRPRMPLPHRHQQNAQPSTVQSHPNAPISICGLQNFGNSCYLNSLIQCLYNIGPFAYFFKANIYVDYLHPVKNSPRQDVCLSYGLGSLFRVMDKHSGSTIAPTRFFNYLLAISDFKEHEQQDVQELLLFILNRLHDELYDNERSLHSFPRALHRYSDDPEYLKWFQSKISKEKLSPINGYFEAQQVTSLNCEVCGFSSKTYSCFNVLSLNLPPFAAKNSLTVSVEELVSFYTSTEELKGADSWHCPECSKRKKAQLEHEKLQLAQKHEEQLRDVLENNVSTDYLEEKEKEKERGKFFFRKKKKSDANGDFGGHNGVPQASKTIQMLEQNQENELLVLESQINQHYSGQKSTRSTNFLSLPSYLILHIQRSVKGARLATKIRYPLILELFTERGELVRYKLQSTVNHSGNSANSGHYTALCNKSNHLSKPRWCQFNDDQFIVDLSHGDIMLGVKRLTSHDVYLLFYERIELE